MLRAIVLLGALLLPTAAAAQWSGRPYVGAALGPNFTESMLSDGGTTQISSDPGPLGDLDLGWAFNNGLRTEVEGSYGSNGISDIKTLRVNGELLPLTNIEGSLALPAVMTNVAYDIRPERFGWKWDLPVQPYIGAGLGYAWLNFDGASGNGFATFRLPQNNIFSGPSVGSFGSDGALAYQAFAGISFPIKQVRGLDWTLEYRYFGTARADVPVTRVSAIPISINGALPSSVTHNGFEAHDNIVLVGLRYAFDWPH